MMTKPDERILREATNDILEAHLSEILEECTNIVEYCGKLRQTSLSEEERDTYEGELYSALTHLQNHIGPALQEWDRLIEVLPEEE